jgi:para-nitrobenzyl esterase
VGDLRALAASTLTPSTAVIQQLGLPVKPIVDGRLVRRRPEETFDKGEQARIPVIIGSANGESGGFFGGDGLSTGGAYAFQKQLADNMVRDGQPVYLFQFAFVPPQARANRKTASHGESVAYAFGTIGMPRSRPFGFQNPQAAARAGEARGRTSRRAFGGSDEIEAVESSAEGQRISDAMMEYIVSFLTTGRPAAHGQPDWPATKASQPKTLVFGNRGIAVR